MEIVLNTYGTSLTCENDGLVAKTDGVKKRLPQYGISSILIGPGVPVCMDHVRAMSVIGLNVDIEMIVQSRGTMFF